MVKMVQGELFVRYSTQGQLCLNKTTQRSGGSESSLFNGGGPSFFATNVPLRCAERAALPATFTPPIPWLPTSEQLYTTVQQGPCEVFCWGKATWPDTCGTAGKPQAEAQLQVLLSALSRFVP